MTRITDFFEQGQNNDEMPSSAHNSTSQHHSHEPVAYTSVKEDIPDTSFAAIYYISIVAVAPAITRSIHHIKRLRELNLPREPSHPPPTNPLH
jgi:hypothetical protein